MAVWLVSTPERQFGALREVGARERQGASVMESLVGRRSTGKRNVTRSIGWVSTSFGEDGGQHGRRRARGVLNSCSQESKERTVFFRV